MAARHPTIGRALLLALLALSLGGCEHMYGAADVRLSDAEAVSIARREAARRHIPLEGLEVAVARFDTGVSVTFDRPECGQSACVDGGVPRFFIPARSRRVSYVRETY